MFQAWKVKQQNLPKYLLALCLSSQVLAAWAQDESAAAESEQPTEDQVADDATAEGEDPAELGRVVVTGSLIQREDFASTSPMQIIDANTQFQAGKLTVADMLQSTTVAAGTTQLNNQFNGFVIQGGTGVQTLDLRGLGATRTLVLLNGRRPGGSGTRGQVNSLDLATIPEIAVQRFELVLDGSSSIYGSDAVAGVANIITRRSVDSSEFGATMEIPLDSGGEFWQANAITGFNTDRAAFTVSAQWNRQEALTVGDRDFLTCTQDLITDAEGNRIDRADHSITAGTDLEGCNDLYANTVIDLFTGARYIPTPDGVTIGPMPGYRPRANRTYAQVPQAYYEDVLNFDFIDNTFAINELERLNIYATMDYSFDNMEWDADFLYSNRNTKTEGWRQFFPTLYSTDLGQPYEPEYHPPFLASIPVMPYPSDGEVDVDFFYFTTGLSGVLPTDSFWTWQVYGAYSRSDGDYTRESIQASKTGDINYGDPNLPTPAPTIDYFTPGILSGADMATLINAVGLVHTGNTVYDQYQVVGVLAGDLFQLPAGAVGAAFGVEYRDFSIDDQPSQASRSGDLWGETSALVTKGSNSVYEAFAEFEAPLIAGKPGFEDVTLNASIRAFDYDQGGNDSVWKLGGRWQIVPSFALRATTGTSYRAPALFEQYLGDETSFLPQLTVDPCIDWGNSSNDNLRTNCQAAGIPANYAGGGASALIISGGGVDNLEPETSDSVTVGLVWTPEFTDLSVAIDYYEIEVNDQIAQLGAANIVAGCYVGENYPNAFCDLFTRAPANATGFPYAVLTVDDTFVNINQQRIKGIDLNLTWNGNYDWGSLDVEAQSTWQDENVFRLFDPELVQGFDETDVVGQIGTPENVTNFRTTASRGDWSYTYFLQHVSETDNSDLAAEEFTYFGFAGARRDLTMDAVIYHNISVFFEQDKWDVLVGVNNLLDEDPDVVSTGAGASRRGNVPVVATQYDLLGRRVFARFNYRF